MGKRRKITTAAAKRAPQSSILDDAFNIQSEMLDQIKVKHEPVQLVVEEAPQSADIETCPAPKREKLQLLELKQIAPNPDIVEWHDTHAPDPAFLAKMKSVPGSVQVPLTWQGREFRSKFAVTAPYKLPKNVYETGIVQQRNVFEDSTTAATTEKQMAKDRVIPKLGTLDLDLAKLKAAFFKNSKRPRLYRFGQVYSPKVEQEIDFSDLKPGVLSDRLKQALGIKRYEDAPWIPLAEKYENPPTYAKLHSDEPAQTVVHWGEHETK